MENTVDSVFIFSPVDFETVQRHTETYYLSGYCGEHFDTHVCTPSSELTGVSNHHFRFDGILGVFCLNVLFVPLWVKLFLSEDPDVVYCYPEVVTPPVLAQLVTDASVVFDIRAEPFEQRTEFVSKKNQVVPAFKRSLYAVDRILLDRVLGRADLVVTLSDDLADKICDNYSVDYSSIHILPLGVDTEAFKPVDSRYDTELNLVYVGTINELRGLDTFVDALALLDAEIQSELRVDLVGAGDEQYIADLLAMFSETAPAVTLKYHGYIDHERVPAVAGRSDAAISLLPGLESYNVSSPAKVYEYLALGLPVIATDIPAHRRILTDGRGAIIVEENSAEAIATAVESLLREPDRIVELSEGARTSALQHNWESRFSALFERIEEL